MIIPKENLSQLNIAEGELIEISRKSKGANPTPPWNMVGNGLANRVGVSIDFIDICAELNQAELRLLKFFRDAYNDNIRNKVPDTNVVVPASLDTYSAYLSKALEKNYKHLEYMCIIVRVKRGTYLINPNLFIPGSDYVGVNAKWEELTNKDSK